MSWVNCRVNAVCEEILIKQVKKIQIFVFHTSFICCVNDWWLLFSMQWSLTKILCFEHYILHLVRHAYLPNLFIIRIQPLGQFGQEPEPSQATSMALVRCILGKFLGVVWHCFPPRLDVPSFTARCLHVHNNARGPSSERWNNGRERLSSNFAYMASLLTPLGIFYMPQI